MPSLNVACVKVFRMNSLHVLVLLSALCRTAEVFRSLNNMNSPWVQERPDLTQHKQPQGREDPLHTALLYGHRQRGFKNKNIKSKCFLNVGTTAKANSKASRKETCKEGSKMHASVADMEHL